MEFLGQFPPSPELAKSFLARFVKRQPRTVGIYEKIIKACVESQGQQDAGQTKFEID
jgi:hypothetical protein